MEPETTDSVLPLVLDALSLSKSSPEARRLTAAFGPGPTTVRERPVGEPPVRSRRLLFASGGEVILHDDAIVAVVLHVARARDVSPALDVSEWIPGVDAAATLDVLAAAIGSRPGFAGTSPYFALDGGYVRAAFRDGRGWNDPGNLVSVTVTIDQPGLACRPEDDDCPTCSDLLVRPTARETGVDVGATVEALSRSLAAGLLAENVHRPALDDLQPLHVSGLMDHVETQLTCASCHRIICFSLHRDSGPAFGYAVLNDAMRHPVEPIPPVELWGDEDRVAADRSGMHYLDHEPGAWFLVAQEGVLYLQARYSYGPVVDDSALIRLDAAERERYRAGGHDALSELADSIHNSAPYLAESRYFDRNLYRGVDAKQLRAAVGAAIVNRTWLAERSGTSPESARSVD